MKILKLRFKNLNSLYGKWEIDFTGSDYESGGIFAITGPTGSGKSTILDAISLALYGETPRLGKITQSTNELMSRLSSDCFAEVEFESAKGYFCCSFSQRKAGNNPGGKLQGPKHEISDIRTGKIIEDRKKYVPSVVEEKTGMDYDRFKRSIMLAQGDFSVFLNSRPAERAPVLEQITGTGIYSEISVRVYERKKKEENLLDSMRESLNSINVLSEEEESDLKQRLNSLNQESAFVKEKIGETDSFIRWVENISRIEDDIGRLDKEKSRIVILKDNSANDLKKLALFRKASDYRHIYDNLHRDRERQSKEKKALAEINAVLPGLKEEFNRATLDYEDALKESGDASRNFNESLEIINRARKSDIIIDGHLGNISSASGEFDGLRKKEEDYKAKISCISENISFLESEAEKLSGYLSENTGVKNLRGDIALIEEKAKKYSEYLKEETSLEVDLNKSHKEISKRKVVLAGRKELLAKTNGRLSRCRERYDGIKEKIKLLLGDREINRLYELDREYSELSSHLKNALRYFEEVESAEETISLLAEESRKDRDRIIALDGKLSVLSGRISEKTDYVGILEENSALASKIKSLDDERKRLVNGEPCPLCGSPEHPYASDIPVFDETKSKIKREKSLLEDLSSELSKADSNIAVLESKIQGNKKTSDELLSKRDSLKEDLDECLDNAKMSSEGRGKDEILKKNEISEGELSKIRSVIRDYEPLSKELPEAEKSLSVLEDELRSVEKEITDAKYSLKEGETVEERISGVLLNTREESGRLRILLENEFSKYASSLSPPEKIGQIPVVLKEILSAYNKKEEEHEDVREKFTLCESDRVKFSALLAEAEKSSLNKSGEIEFLESRLKILKEERFGLFGDKNPDEEEKWLKNLAEKAEAVLLEKREKRESLSSKAIRLESEKKNHEKALSDLNYDITTSNKKFLSGIYGAGFGSESDFE
ncbi:MAG: AAA family ATPase, partial [Euryarchaeota archaeon]|nr:AAA family ATPase [Euryarchaeota archaeon]